MKKVWNFIKELKKSPRGNAILFFAFYFVFFIVLIFSLRSNHTHNTSDKEYDTGSKYEISWEPVREGNYSFSYEIKRDNLSDLYTGQKSYGKSTFDYNGKKYYSNQDKYYVKEKEWVPTKNPYIITEWLESDKLISLIEASSYESTTSYESGKTVYHFLLSSNTINDMIYHISSDYSEEPNKVNVSLNENNTLEEIHFYLDSYCQYSNICEHSLEIKLSFSRFGEIEKIENIFSE